MTRILINKRRISFLLLFLFFHLHSWSQDILQGYVYDTHHNAIPGVTVKHKHTGKGVVTDIEGYYLLRGVRKGDLVEFSYIGMQKQVITFKDRSRVDVVLKEDARKLAEVTVKPRTNINAIDIRSKSGVVAHVDVKRVEKKPMIDIALSLQGSVSGLTVVNTGELGSVPEIRIRGNASLRKGNLFNEPLYVLDGQVISPETFYNLNPSDIKDIKVLKDAAACALYGVKAANGVLEISSQRGAAGSISVNVNVNTGITLRGRRGIKMMHTAEKLELERLLKNPQTPGYRYSEDYFNKYYVNDPNLQSLIAEGQAKLNELKLNDTDWFNELIKNQLFQKYNLSLKGGTDQTSYYVSANYTSQGGRIKGNDKQRWSMFLNMDQKLGNLGYLQLSLSGGYGATRTPNGGISDLTALVYDLNPYETKKSKLFSFPNHTFDDLMHQYSAQSTDKDVNASVSLNLMPLKGLTVSAVSGINLLLNENNQFTSANTYAESHSGVPLMQRGIYSKSKNVTANISSNLRLTYNKVFAEKHDLTIGANTDYYYFQSDNISFRGYGVGTINSAAAINQSINGYRKPSISAPREKNAQIGIGAVLGYTYDGIYDAYATCKWDASSVLPKDRRWNKAWAVGLGWSLGKYQFLKNNPVLTQLKLKSSYGYTANLSGVSRSSTVATFAFSANNYEDIRPFELLSLYNKDLKPEQTKSLDLGIEAQLFKRLGLEVNWYNRRTYDALLDVPIEPSTGYLSLKRNIGVLDNNGVEARINASIRNDEIWKSNIAVSLAYNRNKVIDLYYTDKIYTSEEDLMPTYEVGKSYDMLYGAHAVGINSLTGYPVFLIPDGSEKQATEVLKQSDISPLGHLTPPYSGSINLSMSYKSFDLDMDFYYVFGGVQRFNYTYVRNRDTAYRNAVSGQIDKMWFNVGDENRIYPTPYYTSTIAENNLALVANSRTVGSSDYLKLSLLSLRYRVSPGWLDKNVPWIKYANFSLQASNLYTWTRYKESDPESGKLAGTMQPVYTLNMSLTF